MNRYYHHSPGLQSLADELVQNLAKKRDEKLEQVKRRKAAQGAGIFPGMNRSRKFKDKKKDSSRRACRKKPRSDD